MFRSIKHVFFDLDRTLWDFETNSHLTLTELFSQFKLRDLLGVSSEAFIKDYKSINESFWDSYRNGSMSKENLRYGRFEKTFEHFGVKNPELSAQFGKAYIDQSPKKSALVEGAIDLLEHLRTRYRIHIITNGFSEIQHIKLSSSGLSPYFKHVVISEHVGHKKPSVEVFRYAEKLTGSCSDDSVMIGDHYEADIVGAVNSGWKAIYLNPDRKDVAPETGVVHIRSLSQIADML